MSEIKIGQKYYHYKKPDLEHQYEIIAIGKNSENLEEMIVYKALYKGDFPKGQVWVRAKKEFEEIIEINGKKVKRFELTK